jgi:hypothetical protein
LHGRTGYASERTRPRTVATHASELLLRTRRGRAVTRRAGRHEQAVRAAASELGRQGARHAATSRASHASRPRRALQRASHAGEPREQAAEPGGAAHRAEAAAGPRPRASSEGGPAQDAGDRAGCHSRTPAAMAEPRRSHGRTRRDRATTSARCRAKAGRRSSWGQASRAAAPWPGAGPRRAAGGRAAPPHHGQAQGRAKPRRAEDGTG